MTFAAVLKTQTLIVLSIVSIAASAAEKPANLPRNPTETLRRGDVMLTRLNVELTGDARKKSFEATSFEASSSRTVQDHCLFEVVRSKNLAKSTEEPQALPPQTLESLRMRTEIPDFKLVGFLEDLRPAAEKIFVSVVDVDDLEGPVFKREDLKERLRMAMSESPFDTLPTSTVADIEQAFVAHIWGYWGEVGKLKKKNLDEVKGLMADHRALWLTKLGENVQSSLKEQLRLAQKSGSELRSDRLTRTFVTLNFQWKEDKTPAQSKLECSFEGEKKRLTLDRMNAVINPHFELVPRRRQAMEESLNDDAPEKLRGVAVEGESIKSH